MLNIAHVPGLALKAKLFRSALSWVDALIEDLMLCVGYRLLPLARRLPRRWPKIF